MRIGKRLGGRKRTATIVALFLLVVFSLQVVALAELAIIPRIHVYAGNSVVVELFFKQPLPSYFAYQKASLLGTLDVGEGYYQAMVNVSVKAGSEPPSPHRTYADLSINATGEGYKSTTRFELRIWDERNNKLELFIDPLTSEASPSQMTVEFRGTASVRAVGEAKQVLMMLSMLNKPAIDMYLAQANITWVSVKSLTTTISDDQARIDFDVEIDYAKMAEAYKANTTLIKELFRPSPPTTLSVNLYFDSIDLALSVIVKSEEDVNAALERLALSLKALLELSRPRAEPTIIVDGEGVARGPLIPISLIPIAPVMPPVFEPYLNLLDYFSKNFEIVKSKSTVAIEVKDGILTINLLTPKIVKRGAKSPTETLLALYDFASKVQEELKVEKLLNTTVELAPEAGLKVLRDGVEVKQARLGELKDLKVLIMTSLSISVEPSKVNVGDSVTVRGSITPAMATTVTLIVREPDGTVKRLNTTSSPTGSFSFTVKLEKEGKHSFVASFLGGAEQMASTSPEVYVEVAPAPSPLWLYITTIILVVVVVGVAVALIKRKASSAPLKT